MQKGVDDVLFFVASFLAPIHTHTRILLQYYKMFIM